MRLQCNECESLDSVAESARSVSKVIGCKCEGDDPEEGEKEVKSHEGTDISAKEESAQDEDCRQDCLSISKFYESAHRL